MVSLELEPAKGCRGLTSLVSIQVGFPPVSG